MTSNEPETGQESSGESFQDGPVEESPESGDLEQDQDADPSLNAPGDADPSGVTAQSEDRDEAD